MKWLWWAIPLAIMTFLWTLNEFLRGRLKVVLSGILTILIIVIVAIAFVISGWKAGIAAIVGAFLLIIIFRPVALSVAKRLIKYPDLGFGDYGQKKFEQTLTEFGSESFWEHREHEEEEEKRHRDETVSTAMNNPAIVELLASIGATARDLGAFYDRIEVRSIPPRARESVLNNVELVAFFMQNSEPYDVYDGTYGRKVSESTHIRLQLWIQSNPSGKEPHQ